MAGVCAGEMLSFMFREREVKVRKSPVEKEYRLGAVLGTCVLGAAAATTPPQLQRH